MPLADRIEHQKRGVVIGAIRIGSKVEGSDGRVRPVKLDTFRLTSPDKVKIEAAAEAFGGEVKPWKATPNSPGQWEVYTTVDRMAVRVPPGMPVDQNYELYAGSPVVRQRLCDGYTERMRGGECLCPRDLADRRAAAQNGRACKPVTRLSVILPDIVGLGVWTLTSTGDSAADELAAVARMLQQAEVGGLMLPATLRLEQRRAVGSGEVHQYAVPVLDVGASLAALESGDFQRYGIEASQASRAQAIEGGPKTSPVQAPPPVEPPDAPVAHTPPPQPVGAPRTAQHVRTLALAATTTAAVDALHQLADRRGWLDTYVDGEGDISERLEDVLADRAEALATHAVHEDQLPPAPTDGPADPARSSADADAHLQAAIKRAKADKAGASSGVQPMTPLRKGVLDALKEAGRDVDALAQEAFGKPADEVPTAQLRSLLGDG